MRYEDWDVLIFPLDSKIPLKEFKVACHVVQDIEFSHSHGSVGVPTMTCFVPSLLAGSPFQVSLHSWTSPVLSQAGQGYSSFADSLKLETRVYVDGDLVSGSVLERNTKLPHLMNNSIEGPTYTGRNHLKFPKFRQELLQQTFWSPADELGRIKVVVSEGFPRNSHTNPIERVRNVVAFSFQHAPLDVLESAQIAWPNPGLWRRAPYAATLPATHAAHVGYDGNSHAHTPTRHQAEESRMSGVSMTKQAETCGDGNMQLARCSDSTDSTSQKSAINQYGDWLNGLAAGNSGDFGQVSLLSQEMRGMRSKLHSDTSMHDVPGPSTSEPSSTWAPSYSDQSGGALIHAEREQLESQRDHKVPTNTPTFHLSGSYNTDPNPMSVLPRSDVLPPGFAHTLTNSLLNQPAPLRMDADDDAANAPAEIRSRKENHGNVHRNAEAMPAAIAPFDTSRIDHQEMRKVSQALSLNSDTSLAIDMGISGASLDDSLELSRVDSPLGHLPKPRLLSNATSEGQSRQVSSGGASLLDNTLRSTSGNSMAQGTKRPRNFTPASGKGIQMENEPRRVSPRTVSPYANTTQLIDDEE